MTVYLFSIQVGGGVIRRRVEGFTLADALRQLLRDDHTLLCELAVAGLTVEQAPR